MIRSARHRRLFTRLALLAAVLLLWSQTALAWHADCRAPVAATAAALPAMSAEHGSACHAQPPPQSAPDLCAAHCDQGVPSPDTARVPPPPSVPALVPAPALAFLPLAMPQAWQVDSPPPVPWHRPTPHPAALLLI